MTRRRIIEGTWNCTSCDQKQIPGGQKVCPSCGNPREDEEAKFDFGERTASGASTAATVTEAEKLELAAAGADWYCGACGTANRGDASACKSCGNGDPANRLAKKPELPIEPTQAPPEPAPVQSTKKRGLSALACGVLLLAVPAVLCAGLGLWVLLRAHEVDATVSRLHWSRDLTVETFTPVKRDGWRSDLTGGPSILPRDGQGGHPGVDNLRGCSRRERSPAGCETRTRRVECGTEEKCEVKDLGNGFAEEVCHDEPKHCDEKYEECHEAVHDDWCTYDTYEWRRGASSRAERDDNRPQWPAPPRTGPMDRVARSERYEVWIQYTSDGDRVDASTTVATEAEFARFSVGQPVVAQINNLGTVVSVEPLP